jgi:hypothetical protein
MKHFLVKMDNQNSKTHLSLLLISMPDLMRKYQLYSYLLLLHIHIYVIYCYYYLEHICSFVLGAGEND